MSFKYIDLFCGIGGFNLVLRKLGGTNVFSSEINKKAKETYFQNLGNAVPINMIMAVAKEIINQFFKYQKDLL